MGHCKMTWQLRMSVSQKLASWKGSSEDAKAGKYKIRVNPRNLRLISLRAFCAFLWLINPFNQRNPRLINYLHAFGIFTLVKKSLQIRLFMQNKANFRKSQMNVYNVITKDYEKRTLGEYGKNEPKTNPKRTQTNPKRTQNEPNYKKAKMNVTSYITKGYENISNWVICENEPKTNPIKVADAPWRAKTKPKQTQFLSAISVAGQPAYLLIDRARPEFLNFLLKKPQIREIPYKAGACLCRFVYIRKPFGLVFIHF